MGLTNLQSALDGMSDADLIPAPPPVPVDNTWNPPENAIRIIVRDYFVPAWTNRTPRGQLFREMIDIAFNTYNKVLTRSQLKTMWDAWRAEVVERQSAP